MVKTVPMSDLQLRKQLLITGLLEELFQKTGFDLPYLYNGYEDNLYFMNRQYCIKVGLEIDKINKSSLIAVIEQLNVNFPIT